MKTETIERALAAFTIESDSILATRDAMDMEASVLASFFLELKSQNCDE